MRLWPEPRDLVAVHEATSEFEAITIRGVLEDAGIRVMVRSRLVPGYDVGTMRGGQVGIWADILVLPEQETEARRLIAEYLASLRAAEADAPEPEEDPHA